MFSNPRPGQSQVLSAEQELMNIDVKIIMAYV